MPKVHEVASFQIDQPGRALADAFMGTKLGYAVAAAALASLFGLAFGVVGGDAALAAMFWIAVAFIAAALVYVLWWRAGHDYDAESETLRVLDGRMTYSYSGKRGKYTSTVDLRGKRALKAMPGYGLCVVAGEHRFVPIYHFKGCHKWLRDHGYLDLDDFKAMARGSLR